MFATKGGVQSTEYTYSVSHYYTRFIRILKTFNLTVLLKHQCRFINFSYINYHLRFFDCFTHPNLSATFDLRVIFDQWPKLRIGLDAQRNEKILKGVYYTSIGADVPNKGSHAVYKTNICKAQWSILFWIISLDDFLIFLCRCFWNTLSIFWGGEFWMCWTWILYRNVWTLFKSVKT